MTSSLRTDLNIAANVKRKWVASALGRSWPRDFRLIEFGAIVGLAAVIASLAVPAALAVQGAPGGQHPIDRLLEACQQGVRRGPFAVAGYFAAAALLGWAGVALSKLLWIGSRDARAILRAGRVLRVNTDAVELCVGGRRLAIRVLADDSAVAFTAGLLRPRVHVGRGLLKRLSSQECEAVLLHEAAHARRRDPLRCWLVELLFTAFSFPGAFRIGAAYRAAREAEADAHAVTYLGDDRPLLRALSRVDALAPGRGACALTSERDRALRQVRQHGLAITNRERASVVLGLAIIVTLIAISTVGLSDWQSYWFCPYGGSMRT